jgi:hypothetical protein
MGAKSVFSDSAIEEKGYAALVPGWTGISSNTIVVSELERETCIGKRASLCEP